MTSNINTIKSKLGLETLNFTGFQQSWYSVFDNDNRTLIAIHSSTYEAIKSKPSMETLFLKTEQKTGPKGSYTLHIICQSKTEIVGSL